MDDDEQLVEEQLSPERKEESSPLVSEGLGLEEVMALDENTAVDPEDEQELEVPDDEDLNPKDDDTATAPDDTQEEKDKGKEKETEKTSESKEKKDSGEKKEKDTKKRGFPPKPKQPSNLEIMSMIKLVRSEWSFSTLYVGPLQVEDLTRPEVRAATHLARWTAFRLFRRLNDEQFGTLELRFRSRDDADKVAKDLEAVEGVAFTMKNYGKMKEEECQMPYFLSIVDMKEWDSVDKNMLFGQLENVGVNSDSVWVYMENIPEDMTERELRQELKNCGEVILPRNPDGKPLGFCYAHMCDIKTRSEFTRRGMQEDKVLVRGDRPLHVYRLHQERQGYSYDHYSRSSDDYRDRSRGHPPPLMSTHVRPSFREEPRGVHTLLSGLERILERRERDDRRSSRSRYSPYRDSGRHDENRFSRDRHHRDSFGSGDQYHRRRGHYAPRGARSDWAGGY